jgi:hypothetical protein
MILYVVKVLKAQQSLTIHHFIFLKEMFFIVNDMMSGPPSPKNEDEACPVCNKAKIKHTPEEILACSHKIEESQKQESGKSR